MNERERRLDSIRATAEKMTRLARAYDRLRWMAEQDANDAFLDLAESAGQMTTESLARLMTLLEIIESVEQKIKSKREDQ